tara:strand:+ start:4949 stop:5827 length:879 start_codon:yes stop_codon:yes gene_type:complete
MNILYVTTFNKEIFEASGKEMLNSFLKSKTDGNIFLSCEGFSFDVKNPDHLLSKKWRDKLANKNKKILTYNLSKDSFLNSWLEENKDVIPVHMGGEATPESCPDAFGPGNIRAAGWFRKIATLNAALTKHGKDYDCIVFVDSDCMFKEKISHEMISDAFSKYSVFYHLGKLRIQKGMGVESGFVGFKNDEHGYKILETWISKYKNKAFIKYKRWDDGGMLRYVIEEAKFKHCRDLVKNYNSIPGKSKSHAIERGMFANHVEHYKGLHKNLGIGKEASFRGLTKDIARKKKII